MFPVLSEAKYRMLCSPAGNVSPGCFPYCVMLGMNPELSKAVGWDHVTCVDIVPLSAMATIFDGQFENTGAETSINKGNIEFNNNNMIIHKRSHICGVIAGQKSLSRHNCENNDSVKALLS